MAAASKMLAAGAAHASQHAGSSSDLQNLLDCNLLMK
jgi:hypothetical protein